jgi:Amt family ammonium transporter
MKNLLKTAGLAALMVGVASLMPALAQTATDATTAVAAAAPAAAPAVANSGDTAWMMTSSALVLFMTVPGLALFYGGLVRTKNMLSILMQCTLITAMVMVIWVLWGYTMAFGGGPSPYWGGFGKLFLAGVTKDSVSGTIPEYVFSVFQMTFAAITPALIGLSSRLSWCSSRSGRRWFTSRSRTWSGIRRVCSS